MIVFRQGHSCGREPSYFPRAYRRTFRARMGDAMIEFRGVSKIYPGSERPVVNDLSFEVLDGEICVLVGPSGCGKTTSMRMINRLIRAFER